ncbi:MAG: polyprenyl synthetase family protein [Patescibacteria group bacterium]|nr:polyprenyl synthetase family protein [Patescibacteria group bacterium]
MINEFEREISSYKSQVERRLKTFFKTEKNKTAGISPFLAQTINRLAEFTLRDSSKRIRASLVKIGYEAVGKKAPIGIIDISAAIEIIHSYLLIHDDVIDRDEWRRQGITVHKYFEKYHRKNLALGDSRHFGLSTAILIGVVGNYLANNLVARAKFPPARRMKVINYLGQILLETNYGQLLDIYNEARVLVSKKGILRVYKLKTARYSFEAPLVMGAILAGAKKDQIRRLSRFAIPAGLAFQIRDDILGVFGSKKELGKPVDSDIKEGKQTLLYFEALSGSNRQDRLWLKNHYGKTNLNQRDISRIRQLMIKSGSLEKSRKLARKYVSLAKKSLKGARQISAKSARMLMILTDYLVARNR